MVVKIHHAESPRFPARRKSEQVESAPKENPKGEFDGKQVKNPVLIITAMRGRRKLGKPEIGRFWLKPVGRTLREIRVFNSEG